MNAVREFMEGNTGMAQAFPVVDPKFRPFGPKVLCQIRTPKLVSDGGIALLQETRATEHDNTQVAKVISLGPVAFKDRRDLTLWPEGEWVKPGMFIRVPKYGGDRFERPIPNRKGELACFAVFKDLELGGEILGDPLQVIAFL